MLVRALLLVAAGFSVAFDAKDDAVKNELKKLEGTWLIVSGAEKGKELPKEAVDVGTQFQFAGNKFTMSVMKFKESQQGTFTTDPAKKLKEIDIKVGDREFRGIYLLEGDTLKLCMVRDKDAKRPTDFTTAPDNQNGRFGLKREKQ